MHNISKVLPTYLVSARTEVKMPGAEISRLKMTNVMALEKVTRYAVDEINGYEISG